MVLYPAIDLKDGKCVRLVQGDFNDMTIFNNDPLKQAIMYQQSGAQYIHVVDLDGAKDGISKNTNIIKEMVNVLNIPIKVGGGIRSEQAIKSMLDIGVKRVIIGTKALEKPEFIKNMLLKYPNQVIVSIDAKDGYVAINGWQQQSDVDAKVFCKKLVEFGLKTIVYTDISKDGMMQGLDVSLYEQLKKDLGIEIIASGGVTSQFDLDSLANKNVDGAIIGKALYLGAINLEDALLNLKGE